MLIVCPSCASEYTIDPEKLGADGRTLRCAICRDTWFVSPDGKPGTPPGPEGRTAIAVAETAPGGEPTAPTKKRATRVRVAAGIAIAAVAVLAFVVASGRLATAFHWVQDRIGTAVAAMAAPGVPLEFREIVAEVVAPVGGQDKGAVLLVSGEIANLANHDVTVPHLEILVRNGEEQVLASWTSAPPRPDLGPGEAVRFEMRLASPPPDGRQVRVHFTTVDGIAVAARSPDT